MKRRHFIGSLGLASVALGAGSIKASKPNILFIFADDQTYNSIALSGN